MKTATVSLKILFVKSTIVGSISLDDDAKRVGRSFIFPFCSESFSCSGRLDQVDILKTGEMIDEKHCTTKAFVGKGTCGLRDEAWLR